MRKRLALLSMFAAAVTAAGIIGLPAAPADASPGEGYAGPHYGDGNFPAGCVRDRAADNPLNDCYHMKVGLNALDSPQVDVAVLVPVSPTVERDMRIMRQAVEMWEGGINYLSQEMDLGWLHSGVDFHVTVDAIDLTGDEGGELTTYPLVDPEIVVIATNPVGGVGIGVDPMWLSRQLEIVDENLVPCHTIENPLDFEYWENVPGFDSHHEDRSGTYVEDCGGAGGNVCFAINGAVDPVPGVTDVFSLYDLVSHEFGHCLTVGHVGDGADGPWGQVPTNDIMAYSADPPGLNKCVSTLDVEGFALRMSKYLDVNGDATVGESDHLEPNDLPGDGRQPFQVQHPDHHHYASSSGSPLDCPQPDLGVLPGPRVDWTPEPTQNSTPMLTVSSPEHGAVSGDGTFDVTGSVAHQPTEAPPTQPSGHHDDPDDDATTPLTEVKELDVAVTSTHVDATLSVADLPDASVPSLTAYSLAIDGRRFDSFVKDPGAGEVTWDSGTEKYMPDGWSSWDLVAKTVTFHIPRSYLAGAHIDAPYNVYGQTSFEPQTRLVAVDDRAPDTGDGIGVAQAKLLNPAAAATPVKKTFEQQGGNTFAATDSSFGLRAGLSPLDSNHYSTLTVDQPSTVEFILNWTPADGSTDLDLYVTGAADSGNTGASTAPRETFVLHNVQGKLDIRVDPFLVGLSGTEYTLSATVTPLGGDSDGDGVNDPDDACPTVPGTVPTGCPDADGDGVADPDDVCPNTPGNGADGCPIAATEHVHVYVDGELAATEDVDTTNGPDSFALSVDVSPGNHELRIDWKDDGKVIATASRTVTYGTSGTDTDGDGVADGTDNCDREPNPDQANIDGDAKGDVCDSDMDGDGHSNGKEIAHGTDPADPNSYPGKRRL